MAAGQLPRHDFAPAWLRLPNHENSAWKQGTNERVFYPLSASERAVGHHHRNSYGSRNGIGYDEYIGAQNAPQYNHYGWQRFPSSDFHDYDITYNGAQLRSSGRQVQNGPRSHSQANGSFVDPFLLIPGRGAVVVSGSSHVSLKKSQHPKDVKSINGTTSGVGKRLASVLSVKPATNSSCSTLDEEFPSLNGDVGVVENGKNMSLSATKVPSVWASPNRQLKNTTRSLSSNSGHRSLVLKTGGSKRLIGQPLNELSRQSDSAGIDGKKELLSTPVEDLNACLITHPTTVGDKKSIFLRSLQHGSHGSDNEQNGSLPPSPLNSPLHGQEFDDEIEADETSGLINSIHANAGQSPTDTILSSSFEAEERLLREMGWKGNDDDDIYEITEADVIEFEKLCHQLKVNGSMTKKRNGIVEDGPAKPASTGSLLLPGFMRDVKLPDLGEDASSLTSDSSDDEVFGNTS